jgi:hypothetical protein
MKEPWHRTRPGLFAEVRADVEAFCSTLHVFVDNEVVRIRGTYPVRHESEELDRYHIEIEFPPDYPDRLPIVRETAGRIPWEADRHNSNGVACVLLPEERWWSFPPNKPFLEYLTVPLHNYFLSQSLIEAGGTWPFSEHRHGLDGVIDFYKEQFGTQDTMTAILLLKLVASGRFKGHWPCPCSSGKILRHCHWPGLLVVANRMPRWAAQNSLDNILPYLAFLIGANGICDST